MTVGSATYACARYGNYLMSRLLGGECFGYGRTDRLTHCFGTPRPDSGAGIHYHIPQSTVRIYNSNQTYRRYVYNYIGQVQKKLKLQARRCGWTGSC